MRAASWVEGVLLSGCTSQIRVAVRDIEGVLIVNRWPLFQGDLFGTIL